MTILAMGLCNNWEEDRHDRGKLWIGEGDARFFARMRFGDDSDEHLEACKYGSGMMVEYDKGTGHVFNAGTTDWVAGLTEGCAFTCKITANVIERYLMESMPEEREWKTAYETPKGAGNLAMEGTAGSRSTAKM